MLLIDNYDSFTYNLVQAFASLGAEVLVYRNDAISLAEARRINATHLVISPGPGRPEDAGVSLAMIAEFEHSLPILGVCLGHQCLVQHFGGRIVRAERLMHGKTSRITHDGKTLFSGLPQALEVGRYHSLSAEHETMPAVLELSAQTSRGEIMAVRHRSLPLEGVQFHPESVLTPDGNSLLANFLRQQAREEAMPGARVLEL
ncbi:MAG TPA: aminodeoxychorismate/anthranilate synthase component II [Woeseiaceae bacterium]|nr:aminodeoxychorismate/anthranilate synthase component II [Woeseiaceae bacterium]